VPRRRVFVHLGTPKSGTTHLQAFLWRNRVTLREQGILYPGASAEDHYRSVRELLELDRSPDGPHHLDTWHSLLEAVDRASHTAVISHELLTFADPRAVHRVAADLSGYELHLIITARDAMRQIPSKWQEDLRNGAHHTFAALLNALRADPPYGAGLALHRILDIPGLIARWPGVPAERIHLVVNGPPGTPSAVLPTRFLAVLGTTPRGLVPPTDANNAGLSVHGAELLRRINAGHVDGLTAEQYERLIKRHLGQRTLTRLPGDPAITVPPELRPWVVAWSTDMVGELGRIGVDVRGDLADLIPRTNPAEPYLDPSSLSSDDLLRYALDAMVAQVLEDAQKPGYPERIRVRAGELLRQERMRLPAVGARRPKRR
jgi:hypothetical protein